MTFEYKRLGFSVERRELIEDWTCARATGDLSDVFWRRVKELGLEGWDLVGSFGEFLLFKREAGEARRHV